MTRISLYLDRDLLTPDGYLTFKAVMFPKDEKKEKVIIYVDIGYYYGGIEFTKYDFDMTYDKN